MTPDRALNGTCTQATTTAAIVALLAVLAGPCVVLGQSAKVAQIGLLVSGLPPGENPCVQVFRRGLAELGQVEGRTYVLQVRWAEKSRPEDTFPRFAAEFVKLGVDLIVSVTAQGLREAREAIGDVPVVMASSLLLVRNTAPRRCGDHAAVLGRSASELGHARG
jgi:hypothetical protein